MNDVLINTYYCGNYMPDWLRITGVERVESKQTGQHTNKSGKKKPVYQYDLDGNFIREYPSIRAAAIDVEIDFQSVSRCLRGLQETSAGYKWRYKE